MKKYLQIVFVLILVLLSCVARAQEQVKPQVRSVDTFFNETMVKEHFLLHHPDGKGWEEFKLARLNDLQRAESPQQNRKHVNSPTPMAACTNIDFEDGTLNGWSGSTGYNPGYNSAGCCLTSGGAQNVMSGGGTDPCGGFPVVAPGGSYSLKLGDNGIGGIADRIEQTFLVSASNTFFQYRYAVVLEDPGHALADQPKFEVEMLDGSGNTITCAQYEVSAGQGIPGFQNSVTCAGVIYKPWTTVAMDLSGFIGQNVTIRFTTFDCALGGHFGYAYIDGSCLQFQTMINDTICNNGTMQLQGIPGAATWLWTGGGITGATTQNVTINNAGNYDVQSTSVTGCPLPTIFYDIKSRPGPAASFTTGGNTICNTTVNFTNTSNYPSMTTGTAYWSFGDGATSFLDNPTHTYPSVGTYQVQLIVYSTNGCIDTANSTIQILMPMNSSFTYTANCAGTPAQFRDNSFSTGGSINSWQWNFGDGQTSGVQNPNHIFAIAGTYNVILNVSSSLGCVGGDTMQITINPTPTVNFTSANVCLGNITPFTNQSSISTGSISSYSWDFNLDGITDNTTINPAWQFATSGTLYVMLSASSNNNCTASFTGPVTVYHKPTAAFVSSNTCEGIASNFTNTSSIQSPATIVSHQWDFGDATTSSIVNPVHLYATNGGFNVKLAATSSDGCVGTYNSNITIYPKPIVAFTAPPVCRNLATNFSNTSSVSTGTINSYQWDFNNDAIIDNITANPNYVYPVDGTFLAHLTATTNNNCSVTVSLPVTIYPLPQPDFTSSSSCLGNATQFTDLTTVSSGSITVRKWDFNSDGFIDFTGMNPSYTYTVSGPQTPTLYALTNNLCTASSQKTLFVNPIPQVNFAVDAPSGCPQHCVSFTNLTSVGAGGIYYYNWNFGDGSSVANILNPQHCYSTGNFNVTLKAISDSGCTGSFSQNNMITVFPKPVAGFSYNPTDPDVLEPLVNIVDGSAGANNWVYHFSDGTDYITPDPHHLFATQDTATYTITQIVSNNYGCYDTATQEVSIKPAFTLYVPNAFTPDDDGKNDIFRAEGIGVKVFNMWIFDRWGNMIFFTDDFEKGWDGKVEGGHSGEASQMDVYVWKAKVKDINDKSYTLRGKVTLVR